jgi:excinuclease ABC subunit A
MGPEGGDGGGEIVAQGMPEDIIREKRSHTGRFLKEVLARRPMVEEKPKGKKAAAE